MSQNIANNNQKGFVKVGVIGHPIGHSKSPLIHNYWIEKYGLHGHYEALDIAPDNLEREIRALAKQGYKGFNLTIPHKELAFNFCDQIDSLARAVGAVNTITIENGELIGTNTDIFGFTENIHENAPAFNFKAGAAVILGAGGAARAVLHGLLCEDVPEIIILNRTSEKAEALAKECTDPARMRTAPWDERSAILDEANLLINTTALGMSGQAPLDLSLENLPSHALVSDIVYAPLYTPLLQEAEKRGNPIVTGVGMLLHQARPAFGEWFSLMPDISPELIKQVLA